MDLCQEQGMKKAISISAVWADFSVSVFRKAAAVAKVCARGGGATCRLPDPPPIGHASSARLIRIQGAWHTRLRDVRLRPSLVGPPDLESRAASGSANEKGYHCCGSHQEVGGGWGLGTLLAEYNVAIQAYLPNGPLSRFIERLKKTEAARMTGR